MRRAEGACVGEGEGGGGDDVSFAVWSFFRLFFTSSGCSAVMTKKSICWRPRPRSPGARESGSVDSRIRRPRSRGVWGVSSRRIASVAYLARALEHLRSGARPERLHAAGPVDGPERLQRALAPVRPHARLPHLERHAERRRLHALDETADGEVNGRHGRRDEKSRSGGGRGTGARATRASAGARPNASKLFVEQSSKKVRENIRAVIRRGAR